MCVCVPARTLVPLQALCCRGTKIWNLELLLLKCRPRYLLYCPCGFRVLKFYLFKAGSSSSHNKSSTIKGLSSINQSQSSLTRLGTHSPFLRTKTAKRPFTLRPLLSWCWDYPVEAPSCYHQEAPPAFEDSNSTQPFTIFPCATDHDNIDLQDENAKYTSAL